MSSANELRMTLSVSYDWCYDKLDLQDRAIYLDYRSELRASTCIAILKKMMLMMLRQPWVSRWMRRGWQGVGGRLGPDHRSDHGDGGIGPHPAGRPPLTALPGPGRPLIKGPSVGPPRGTSWSPLWGLAKKTPLDPAPIGRKGEAVIAPWHTWAVVGTTG